MTERSWVIIMILLNIFLGILSIAGLLLFVFGFVENARLYIVVGGIAIFAPIFYLLGWFFLLPMAPPLALAISFLGKKEGTAT